MVYKVIFVLTVATISLTWFISKEEPFDSNSIKGRNVVITGASGGIGEQLAYQYAKLGANVFITARRKDALQKVIEKCKSLNPSGQFGYYVADMGKYKTESMIFIQKAVEALGGIDSLIVNHAYSKNTPVWHGTEEELELFEKVSQINYNSHVHIASHALPYLKSAKKGRLGITSAIGGKIPILQLSVYCGAKFAQDGFFSTLRDELTQAKTNVTVTLAFLGAIATEGGRKFGEEMGKTFGAHPEWIVSAADFIWAAVDESAEQIMKATETGKAELYYPYWFASRLITYPASWTPIARHIWSTFTEIMVFSEDFYKYKEPAN